MLVVIVGRGLGGGGVVANAGVHYEASGYHFVIYSEFPHL